VCLGSQVLARAFGAANILGGASEFGWCEVALTDAGSRDAVLGGLPAAFPIFQWHADTFTLPPGAVQLATGAVAAQQGFRIGRATYGLQFHFEANRRVVADWVRTFPKAVARHDPRFAGTLPDGPGGAGIAADAAGLAIARNWVALI
jgi:GMP synthase-like glutamine amidotransferase